MERGSRRADGWIFGGFLALLVWAPIPLGSNRPWAWSILVVGIYALSAAWLLLFALGWTRFPSVFRRSWGAVSLLGLWTLVTLFQVVPLPIGLVAILSPQSAELASGLAPAAGGFATLSVDPESTRQFVLRSFGFFLAFCLTLVLVRRRSRLNALVFTLVGSGLLQAIIGSFLHMRGENFEIFFATYQHAAYSLGTFVNRNHFAGYLEMTLAIGIGAMIATLRGGAKRTWRQRIRDWLTWTLSPRVLLRVVLVIMVIGLVMTRSRMGNSAFFASMLVAGLIGLALSRHATRSTVILLVSLVIIDVFIVGTWFGMEKLVQRLEETTIARAETPTGMSVEERVEPGKYALGIVREYPWFGSGGGTFYVAFSKFRPPEIVAFFDFAHNDFIQFAAETGLVGLSILGLLVLSTLWVALKTQYERSDPLARGVGFGVTMGIVSLMIHSWVDFNLQIPANALTFTVLLAMGWVAYSVERQ